MSNYKDWTAGRHWHEAMALLERADESGSIDDKELAVERAVAHLAVARLLLAHPPVDVLDAYPVERDVEPPKDWRDS
jgi:hypothetical protein